jgi:HK97 family phage prohead protease
MRTFEATAANPGPDGNAEQHPAYRSTFALRDSGRVGHHYLEGRAVPYDTPANVGWFMEAHAFKSLERSTRGGTARQLPLLLFHDNRSWPAGHAEQWTHEADGLHGVWRLNDTPEAQQAAELAAAGDLTGLSIGFQPIRSQWEMLDQGEWDPDAGPDHMDRVTRLESRLLEVSLTPTPVFADAEVTMVRHARRTYSATDRRTWLGGTGTPELDHWRRLTADLHSR